MLETGIALLLGAVAALAYALYCRLQAVRHRQKRVERRRATRLDPVLLTERGRAYRRRSYIALVLGFLAIVAGLYALVMSIAGVAML